jgi:hypothetical protein
VRLTAFARAKTTATRATMPDAAVAHGKLHVALSLELDPRTRQVVLLSVPLAELHRGLDMQAPAKGARPSGQEHLGVLVPLSKPRSRNVQPRVACSEEGCYVAWNDEKAGASLAFVERDKPHKLWSREFAAKGASPGLANGHGLVQMAWFEESRVHTATVTRDGVGKSSTINRVNGFQPTPALAPSGDGGEWLVAWRDYEAAHLEVFALRAGCR